MAKNDTHELITPSPAMFAGADNIAGSTADTYVLVGRMLLGWIFLTSGWGQAYRRSAGSPDTSRASRYQRRG